MWIGPLSDASREALARKQFGQELKVRSSSSPITILSDNQSALDIAENPANYRKAKHIDIRYHFICWIIEEGKMQLIYCPTDDMVADVFTKALPSPKVKHFASELGLSTVWRGVLESQTGSESSYTLSDQYAICHSLALFLVDTYLAHVAR